ncbi:MAG: type II toxin-antitoxin system YafQ family toxin [Terracidiphilus sp.]|jgi:mRNA interferase YafQ
MRAGSFSSQFHSVVKRLQKRGKDLEKLKKLIGLLLAAQPLPPEYKDHPLKLNWAGYRDADIESDWVLIYSATAEKVRLERRGTHEELFEND